jgi:hypothetical protein
MPLRARGAGNTRCDVFLQTQLAYAKGMLLGRCGGSTRDDTCIDAKRQESNASNILREDDQQSRGTIFSHRIDCASMTRSLTSSLLLLQWRRPLRCLLCCR